MWPAALLTPEICHEFRRLLAMEMAALRLIDSVIDDLPRVHYPQVNHHRDETLWQIDLLQTSAELLGAQALPSPEVPHLARPAWGGGLNALRALSAFEISNYQSALFVARRVPIPEIAEICQELLAVEKIFRRWLSAQGAGKGEVLWQGLGTVPRAADMTHARAI